MKKRLKTIGQVTIGVALIGVGGSAFIAMITSWATSSNRTAKIETQVSVVEERENNHYLELKEKLDDISGKIDQLLGIKIGIKK